MTAESSIPVPRLFLDANMFVNGVDADWGAAKAVLILGTLHLLRIETSTVVLREVERALDQLGMATGLRIATPQEFLTDLVRSASPPNTSVSDSGSTPPLT